MHHLQRRTICSVLSLAIVSGATVFPGSASAAAAHPVTLAQLESASVPALCGHPAGRLVKGALPGIAAGKGKVVLAATAAHHGGNALATGDLNGDGVPDAAAVVVCTTGNTSRGASIQLYTSGGRRLGGFSLDAYTKRPTDVVASVTIAHRKVVVHWTANQTGDAPCCPTLDYSVDLTLKGASVVPSHPHTYNDAYVAETLAGYIRGGNKKAALTLATPHVQAQLAAAFKQGKLASVYGSLGSPVHDSRWGVQGAVLGVRGTTAPAWLSTTDRYALGSDGTSVLSIIRLKHLGWRKWRADYFLDTTYEP